MTKEQEALKLLFDNANFDNDEKSLKKNKEAYDIIHDSWLNRESLISEVIYVIRLLVAHLPEEDKQNLIDCLTGEREKKEIKFFSSKTEKAENLTPQVCESVEVAGAEVEFTMPELEEIKKDFEDTFDMDQYKKPRRPCMPIGDNND